MKGRACPLEEVTRLACPLEEEVAAGAVPSRRGGLAARSPRRRPLGAATSSPTPVLTCSLPSPPSSPPSPPSSPSSTSTTSPPRGRCTRRPRCCSRHGNSCCCRHRTCCSCCFIVRDPPCCSRELLWSSQHHFTSSSSMCCCHSTREAAVDGATWVRAPGVSSPHPTGDLPLLGDRRQHPGAPHLHRRLEPPAPPRLLPWLPVPVLLLLTHMGSCGRCARACAPAFAHARRDSRGGRKRPFSST